MTTRCLAFLALLSCLLLFACKHPRAALDEQHQSLYREVYAASDEDVARRLSTLSPEQRVDFHLWVLSNTHPPSTLAEQAVRDGGTKSAVVLQARLSTIEWRSVVYESIALLASMCEAGQYDIGAVQSSKLVRACDRVARGDPACVNMAKRTLACEGP